MSNLLTRRRVLTAIAADQVEGGGPNDGKYVWLKCINGSNTNYWSGSSDYGQTYASRKSSTVHYSDYSCSFNTDCSGSIYFTSGAKAKRVDFNETIITGGTALLIRTSSGTGNSSVPLYVRSYFTNRDGSKVLMFKSNNFLVGSPPNQVCLVNFENHSRTGSVLLTGSMAGTLPWITTGPEGPFVEANRETLQYVIGGQNGRQRSGVTNSGSISYDYGQTWTPIENVLFTSQSNSPNKMRGAAWSDKGDKCLVVYGADGDSYLYYSKDYGQSFTRLNIPLFAGNVQAVYASEKFGTIYAVGVNASTSVSTICRSRNKGKTWDIVKTFGTGGTVFMDCNAKGDKLAATYGVGNSQAYISYSLDYGDTWGQSNLRFNYPAHPTFQGPKMSRDYVDNTGESPEPPGPGETYSMSLAQVKNTLESALNQQKYVRYSINGSTLSSAGRLQFVTGDPWEYQGCTYYENTISAAPLIQGTVIGDQCAGAVSYVELTSFDQTWEESYPNDMSNGAIADFIAMSMNSARGSNPMYIEIL